MVAAVFIDRVLETCAVPGTGTVSLLGAQSGPWQSFNSIGNGNTTYYCIVDQAGNNWEVGSATFTLAGRTLTRTAGNVLDGTNGPGVLVNFASGTQNVFGDAPATLFTNAIYRDGRNAFTANQSLGGNRLTNLANGIASTDAATVGQLPAAQASLLLESGSAAKLSALTPITALGSADLLYIDHGGASNSITWANMQSSLSQALASLAGVATGISTTSATATASTTAGVGVSITADNAVAGTTNAGAAAGGSVNITAGNAAQKTSGNANGGAINLQPGAGIGTGNQGLVSANYTDGTSRVQIGAVPGFTGQGGIWIGLGSTTPTITNTIFRSDSSTFLVINAPSQLSFAFGNTTAAEMFSTGLELGGSMVLSWPFTAPTLGLAFSSAGVLEFNNGTKGTASATPGLTIPNAAAGAGSPFTITGSSAAAASGLNGGDLAWSPGLGDGGGTNGRVTFPLSGNTTWWIRNIGGNQLEFGGSFARVVFDDNNDIVQVGASGYFGWTASATDPSGSCDTFIKRVVGGVVGGLNTWFQNTSGRCYLTSNFTNAINTPNNTTISFTVIAGRVYSIKGKLNVGNSTITEGVQFDFAGGTATATSYDLSIIGTNGTVTLGTTTTTALGTALTLTSATAPDELLIVGQIKVNAGGTLILRFAENSAHVAGTATLAAGSWIELEDMVQV